jgi:osmotically-inducible protein OsmY
MAQSIVSRDAELQQQVFQELRWDRRLKATEVGVSVEDGIVRLTGTVDSYAEKLAAQEAAHRVLGVLDVVNDIDVHPIGRHGRTDLDIAQAVRWELEWNVLVPHEQIRSTVSDGWVTLEGSVNTWQQRIDAETAIRYLAGVRGITNRIVVKGPEIDTDEIRRSIEVALERRAKREARRIRVDVHDGRIALTGLVRSWSEKQAVLGAAGHVPGVHGVEDNLEIDPYS